MTKNKRKIFQLFVIMLACFVFTGKVSAVATAGTCVYKTSDGNNEIKVEIGTDGSQKHYDYVKWEGSNRTETGSGDMSSWKSGYFDIYAYEKQPNASLACPPYIHGSFAGVNILEDGFYSHLIPTFTTSSSYSYSDSVDNRYRDHQKTLPLVSSSSSFTNNIANPRPVTGLVYKLASSTTFSDAEAKATDFSTKAITVQTNKKYMVYIKGKNGDYDNAAHFSTGTITCTNSNNSPAIKNISAVDIRHLLGSKYAEAYKPIASFTFETETPTQGTAAIIKCTYKHDSITGVTTTKESSFNVTVEGTAASTNYAKRDVECLYTLKYDKGDLAGFKVKTNYYKDGYGTFVDSDITFSVELQDGSYATFDSTTEIKTCKKCSSSNPLKISLTKQQFWNALYAAGGTCPILYTGKSTGLFGVFKYWYVTTVGTTLRDERIWQKNTNHLGVTTTENFNENLARVCQKTLSYTRPNGSDTYMATISFSRIGNTFEVQVPDASPVISAKTITTNVTNNNNLELTIYNYNYAYGGSSSTSTVKLNIDYKYLKHVYDTMASSCSLTEPQTNVQEPVNNLNYGPGYASSSNTKTYNWALNAADLPEVGVDEDAAPTDGTAGTTVEGTGTDAATRPSLGGGIDDWNFSYNTSQTPQEFCEVLFGSAGSPNKVAEIVKGLIVLIRIGVPVVLVLTVMLDFTKATGNDEQMPKAKKNAITRFIIAVIILFTPSLIKLVLGLVGWSSCSQIF